MGHRSAPLFQADLERVDEIKRMFREVEERLGSLYGLVNNAARFRRRDAFEITEADWDFIHNINLKATFFCCQQGALLMKKTGAGRIVNLSSLGGIRPWDMYAHYCEGRRDHADAGASQGVRARDHGELGGAGRNSCFRRGYSRARADRGHSGETLGHP